MVRIRDTDRGYRKLMQRLRREAKRKHIVRVGVMGPEGQQEHKGSGTTVVEVASYHEFGRGVPERSFIRSTVDENEPKYRGLLRRIGVGIVQGKVTAKKGLNILGLQIVSDIQGKIESNIPPKLHPSTVAQKGSSVALIDTGQLKNSVVHQVVS